MGRARQALRRGGGGGRVAVAGGPPGALESRTGRREDAAAGHARYFRNPVEIHGTAAITTMPTAIELR